MENVEIKKVYNLTKTPWYFGAYLNMARHNVYLLINHLTEKFSYLGYIKISDDEQIGTSQHLLANIFDTTIKKNDEERFKVYKYLVKRHYLPFIKIFHEKNGHQLDSNPIVDYDKLHKFINSTFRLLTEFRDSYSHYLAIDNNGVQIKDRKQDVTNEIKQSITLLFNQAPEFSLKRFEKTQEEKDYNHLELYQLFEENTTKLTEHGFYFFINLFLERSYAIKFLKKISGFKNETIPAFRATIQTFTAYSLKVPDVRLDNDDRKFALLLEMLNELQRCPKELFYHLNDEGKKKFEPNIEDNGKNNILLNSTDYQNIHDEDIDSLLSEITTLKRKSNRFPYFILRFIDEYDLLPNIRFQITLGKLHTDNYGKTITGVTTNRRILKTINAFGKLSDFENKEEETLSELKTGTEENEKVYFEQYAPHYNMKQNKIPIYLFKNDESKVKYPNPLLKKEDEQDHNKPTGFISLNDLPKLALLAYYKPDEVEKVIKAFIKKNQYVGLNVEKLEKIKSQLSLEPKEFTRRIIKEKNIQGKSGKTDFLNKQIETNLLKQIRLSKDGLLALSGDEIKKRFKNKKDKEYIDQIRYINYLKIRREELQKHLPDGMLVNQLPAQVLNYLLNISEPDSKKIIHQKIRSVKDDCKLRVKRLKKELEKNKEEQSLKLGELATFMARDIIDMVIDQDVKQKITSPYAGKLQNKIAYFSISKNEIIELCDELSLFDKNSGHVFLSKELINKSKGVIEFYKDYLDEKKKWVETNLFIKGKTGGYVIPENKKIPLSLLKMANDLKNHDFNNWLANKSKMPIELPNTLFDTAIAQQLAQNLNNNRITFGESDKFSVRLSKLLSGDTQPFYTYKRVYKLNEEIVEFDIHNLDGKTIKAKYGKFAESNEKTIRFIQSQDRILRLLCEKILLEGNISSPSTSFDLKSIFPFSENSPLNRPFKFKQRIIRKGNEYFTVIAEDNEEQIQQIERYKLLTTDEERTEFKEQKGYEWTMKDFGHFKKMVTDRRIPKLSAYFESKEITFDFLEYQLKEYDKYREKIFEFTFDLEKQIGKIAFEEIKGIELKHREELKKKGKEKEYNEVQFNEFCAWIKENNILDSADRENLKGIRDRFSHSEFPDYYSDIAKISKKDNDNFERRKHIKGKVEELNLSISKKLFEMYQGLAQNLLYPEC